MYTLKLDWSEERTKAVRKALQSYLADQESSFMTPDADVAGALADIALYRQHEEESKAVLTEILGSYQQTITDVLIEYRAKGSGTEWYTWVHFSPGEEPGDWRKRKISDLKFYAHLQFRLLRRTTVITDEVLDTEGE
jgi:hypothetical protein